MGPVDLVINKPPQEKIRSGVLSGHVMYNDPLPMHLTGSCSSKNVRTMLAKCGVCLTSKLNAHWTFFSAYKNYFNISETNRPIELKFCILFALMV